MPEYAIRAVKLNCAVKSERLIKIIGCDRDHKEIEFVFMAKANRKEPRTGEWLFEEQQFLPTFTGPSTLEKRQEVIGVLKSAVLPELIPYFFDPIDSDLK
jgi:hypothetical protein